MSNFFNTLIVASVSFAVLSAPQSYASEKEVEAFYGICLHDTDPFTTSAIAADLFGYPPLDDDVLAFMAPAEAAQEMLGWAIPPSEDLGLAVLIVTKISGGEGDGGGGPDQTCTLILRETDPEGTVADFERLLMPSLVDSEDDGIQRSTLYELEVGGKELMVLLTRRSAADAEILNLAAMIFGR